MKNFLAVYIGTQEALERFRKLPEAERKQRSEAGFQAWMQWGTTHAGEIVDQGAPLGKTKRVAADGITDVKNHLTGYIIVRAESHEAAAKLFENHPHFTLMPGESVEIMECLPMPAR